MARVSFREKVQQVREDAIVAAVNRLLAEKGFDLMTVDEVAAEVGIAKASLYRHFASKEAFAAAAMVRVLGRTQETIAAQPPQRSAIDKLTAVTRWAVEVQLAGEMPTLPSQNSSLRAELLASRAYTDGLLGVSESLGAWIVQAQAEGSIDPALPPEVVLFTLFACACDPVAGFLKAAGRHDERQIADWVVGICIKGLAPPRA